MGFGYPMVRVADIEDIVFPDDWDTPSVSLAEFEQIQARGKVLYGEDVLLMPGAQVGEFDIYAEGKSPDHLFEIERVNPGGLLFSMRVLEALACSDIFLPHSRHEVRQAGGKTRFYGLLQAPVYRMLHSKSLEDTGNQQCARCGGVIAADPRATIPPTLYFVRPTVDFAAPVFRVLGYHGNLFLRDDVARILQSIDNLGANLKAWGQWT